MRPLLMLCVVVLVSCDERCESAVSASSLPATLSATGWNEGLRAYRPRFELWSDGASKRRWLSLPETARIDTTNPDAWQFPVGATFFKEFTRDGVRVETRVLRRDGPGDDAWSMGAYLWRADQSDADFSLTGAVDAAGTAHDVPSAGECWACHGGRSSRVLGVSAVQLDDSAFSADDFTAPVEPVVLGRSPLDEAALGYLHANCSHCHNGERRVDGPRCYQPGNRLDFSVPASGIDDAAGAPAARRAGNVVDPRQPEQSEMLRRLQRGRMPPLAVEVVDAEAVETLRRWIPTLSR